MQQQNNLYSQFNKPRNIFENSNICRHSILGTGRRNPFNDKSQMHSLNNVVLLSYKNRKWAYFLYKIDEKREICRITILCRRSVIIRCKKKEYGSLHGNGSRSILAFSIFHCSPCSKKILLLKMGMPCTHQYIWNYGFDRPITEKLNFFWGGHFMTALLVSTVWDLKDLVDLSFLFSEKR